MDFVVISFASFVVKRVLRYCCGSLLPWFLHYLVLLNAHLKISRLCKWHSLGWKKESPNCAGQSVLLMVRGRRSQPSTVRSGMLPFLQTHQASNCLVLELIDCLWKVRFTKMKNSLFSYIPGFKPCFRIRMYVTLEMLLFLLYCELFMSPSPPSYNSSSMLFVPFFIEWPVFSTFGYMWE